MIYLSEFYFPSQNSEANYLAESPRAKMTCYDSFYPFGLFAGRGLKALDLADVTILYGGNGSGKTTALNVMADALRLQRGAQYNRGDFFPDYVSLCQFHTLHAIPAGSLILTSDDVFDYMLDVRAINDNIDTRRGSLFDEYTEARTAKFQMNILQQASPRMFLALGVAGLILLAGTDLSIGRMVGMGMTAATIIMHKGINTGAVFGHVFDFTGLPVIARVILALLVCIVLCTVFTTIAGFFTAKFKMHPFISTMANMLVIFGLVTYSTKGVSFGGIESNIPSMIIPKIGGFPTIILWAIAAVIIVWFIWNKTTLGKNLFAVGGNPEAAAVSGISVFRVTVGAFVLAGILYGFGSWLECIRMVGSGSAAYGQGWEMDAIAACVVGGVSFTGGIGKISGVVVGVFIFTALTYSLTTLGIDTNLQFVFSGIIILVAVMLDCLKYVQKK